MEVRGSQSRVGKGDGVVKQKASSMNRWEFSVSKFCFGIIALIS